MKAIDNKQIAIVGGGPGGLTLARLLQLNGAAVTVYERDAHKDARPKGATLDLHDESGLRALREAGLMDAFMANYRPGADKLKVMDKDANIVFADNVSGEGAYARPEIDRGPLQQLLLDSLVPGTVIWDCHFVAMRLLDNKWQLEFKNGSTASADIVIAADGANSKLRPYITPVKPFYTGITAVEGAVYDAATATPEINALLDGGKIFTMGDEKSLIVGAKGDGSLAFYAGLKKPEHWYRDSGIDFTNREQVLAWFGQEFAGWSPLWKHLFENMTGPLIPRPQYCMPLDQSWVALPNLTMLGDAAHLMPPYAGEGVNMAMLDALELSLCLTSENFSCRLAAVSAYETAMRARASETAALTLESTAALHSPEAISFLINVVS